MRKINRLFIVVVSILIFTLSPSFMIITSAYKNGEYKPADIDVLSAVSYTWDDLNDDCKAYTYDVGGFRKGSKVELAITDVNNRQHSDWNSENSDAIGKIISSIDNAGSSNSNAKSTFEALLDKIVVTDAITKNTAKVDWNKTFEINDYTKSISDFSGTELHFMYNASGRGSGSNSGWYLGCDYSGSERKFIYYYFSVGESNLAGDNCTVCVFKSDGFYAYTGLDGNSMMTGRIIDVANIVQADVDKSIFGEMIKANANNTSIPDYSGRVTLFNDLLQYAGTDNSMHVVNISSYGIASVSPDGDDFYVDVSKNSGGFKFQSLKIDLDKLASDEVTWGNSGGLFPTEATSNSDSTLANFVEQMIKNACNTAAGATSNIADVLAGGYLGTSDSFSYTVFSILKDKLDAVILDSYVNMNTVELEFYTDDPFDIMSTVMRYQVKEIVASGKNPFSVTPDVAVVVPGRGTLGITITGEFTQGAYSTLDFGLKEVWEELNDYQRDVLTESYCNKLTSIGYSPYDFKFHFIENVTADFPNKNAEPFYADADDMHDMLDMYNANELMRPVSVTQVARVSNLAAHYVLATSAYSTGEGSSNSNSADIFNIYNAALEDMVTEQWDWSGDSRAQKDYLPYMPKRVGKFGEDSEQYAAFAETPNGFTRLVSLFYNVEYAFEIFTNSLYGTNDIHSSLDDLQEFFKGTEGHAPVANDVFTWMTDTAGLSAYESKAIELNFNNDSISGDLFRSIIELHDMCLYLEIEIGDWSPVIDAYLQIYYDNETFFTLLRNNNYIYSSASTGFLTAKEPLGRFFSIENYEMSDQWDKGFALSALYVPMETNLYDSNSIIYLHDPDWISEFYYRYAFYRKALYINTDSSALVNKAVTGQDNSGRKIATLRDLINYERDIILTVDDNFYNAGDVSNIIDKVDYSAVRNAGDGQEEVEGDTSILDKMKDWASGLFDLDAGTILKTGPNQYYSQNLAEHVTQLSADRTLGSMTYDTYLLSAEEILGSEDGKIKSVFDDYEYSVKQSYGVVSAIYRNADLYNECLRGITSDNAIFKSSKNICKTSGTNSKDWLSIYNYCMLSNLEEQMKNNTNTTLDLDAPLFCDIFGNIITESGLVVIPAAANATLCGENWTPYTVGWSEYYNNGNRLVVDEMLEDVYTWLLGRQYTGANTMAGWQTYSDLQNTVKDNGGGYMSIDNSRVLVLRDVELTSNNLTGIIQFEMPNKNSTVVQNLFFNDAYFSKAKSIYSHRITNMVVEVLRGAPIENINYTYESLAGPADISKYGVYVAYKLEELMKAFLYGEQSNDNGGNSIVTMPNLAFMTGVEYIMLYVFKIVFAVLLVALVVQLYLDATKNSLGLRSFGKFILTCMMVIVAFTLVPRLISWSYYKANKDLLADEAGYIMMLNYVKDYDGTEIGITSIETPETNTELYVRVSDVHVNWWKIIPEVLFGNTFSTVTELYEDTLKNDAMAMQENVQLKGDGLYIDVQDIYNSTNVMYTPSNSVLINYSTALTSYISPIDSYYRPGESVLDSEGNPIGGTSDGTLWAYERDPETGERIPESEGGTQIVDWSNADRFDVEANDRDSVASFVMPYYAILDQLIANVNEYNASRGIKAYGWSVGANGHILTYDILTPYLTSAEFLEEGYDILGMQYITKLEHPQPIYNRVITDDDIAKMEYSLWYPGEITNSLKAARLNELYKYARNYIADNRYVLGKVPDEVFIKVFAMQLAIKYNQIFNISEANAIEIINVDTRDLMRFMIGDKGNVYKYYSYGFARYCYEQAGVIGVIFSALLTLIYWLTSFLKAIAMALILTLLIFNCVFRKQLFHKDSRCIEGYLIACACLCLCNYAYSLMLKLSMILNDLGTGAITALIFAFLIQILYVAALLGIVAIEIKDWRNNGLYEFYNIGGNISSGLMHARNVVVEKLTARHSDAYSETAHSRQYVETNDNPTVGDMLARDAEREERGTYSPD